MADAKLRRLYVPQLPADGGKLVLPDESAKHVQVLRLSEGDRVELFDAYGGAATATLERVARGHIECSVTAMRVAPEPRVSVTLVLGVPKGPKLEPIVRMTTELGVHALHFAQTERAVPKLSSDSPKLERLARVAREACAQSGTARAPELTGPRPLLEVAASAPRDALKLVFWEEAQTLPFANESFSRVDLRQVWAVVGPEGGLSAAEVERLEQLGYLRAGLGESILRVDTAAVVIAALVLDRIRNARPVSESVSESS
jgi:16S rRNA (uracil1498-N3)-methyltransferase